MEIYYVIYLRSLLSDIPGIKESNNILLSDVPVSLSLKKKVKCNHIYCNKIIIKLSMM